MRISSLTTRWTTLACALVLAAGLAACATQEETEVLERDDMELGTDPYATDTDPYATDTYDIDTEVDDMPATPAPADAPAATPPPAAEPAAATASAVEIFAARCETCHDASEMAGVGQRYDRPALTALLRGETEIDDEGETHRRFRGSDEDLATLVSWLMEQN